jgi:hypothetical protein
MATLSKHYTGQSSVDAILSREYERLPEARARVRLYEYVDAARAIEAKAATDDGITGWEYDRLQEFKFGIAVILGRLKKPPTALDLKWAQR